MSDIYLGDALVLDEKHHIKERRPFNISRRLWGHLHGRGTTGSGKSSLCFTPLIDEFSKPYMENGKTYRDVVIVICFGGDQNMFWNAEESAKRSGCRFRYLTLDPALDSHYFPPFQAVDRSGKNVIRIAQMLIRAFHMEHGLVYGGNYFSQQNLAALLRVARKLAQEKPDATLEDIARYLDDPKNKKLFRDADQVRMTFDFLLEYPQLSVAPNSEKNIDLHRALDPTSAPELLYFFCPTLEEPITAPLVGGLALYSIISVAIYRKKHGLPLRRIRIFIDEFQEIVGRSLAALLAQSRKFQISLFLANQSTSQLTNRDVSLADVVFEGCSVRQYYTVSGQDDVEVLQSLAKDSIKVLGGGTSRGLQSSQNYREIITPALERDQTLEVSSRFGWSYLVLSDGHGYQAPIVLEQKHRFPDFSNKPMPARTVAPAESASTWPKPSVVEAKSAGAPDAAWQAKLQALWTKKCALEAQGIVE